MFRAFACILILLPCANAYSVLTHQAIVDSAWDANIKPLLLARFPQATPDNLREAHAYAYGGSIIQDMGYYPFGSHFFTDLVHYVRSGDFVVALIKDSEDLDEYAFALGSLAHYAADNNGHPIGVNRSVAVQYPKLAAKFGPVVTYEDKPSAHLKVEFGFDVLQVARGRYAPEAYHDFIGFHVSKPLLQRAFLDTYGLELKEVFTSLDLALGTYRRAVSSVIPEMTKVAWQMKKDELIAAQPGLTKRKFVYNLSRAGYHKEWDGEYREPGIGARVLAWVIRVMPKIGPLRALSFKTPTPETEKFFEESFNRALAEYRTALTTVASKGLMLQNRDFDTGHPTRPGEYRMADNAYAELARKLADHDPSTIPPEVVANILGFYQDPNAPNATKKDADTWKDTLAAVEKLRTEETVPPKAPSAPGTALPLR